ncbi:MAG: DUF4476 domain-containing protein, partial [Proteobacteria bacterium]
GSENNPTTESFDFEMRGAPKLKLDLFGSTEDVNLFYVDDLAPNTARIKLYRVFRKQASWGSFGTSLQGDSLRAGHQGTYQCSINIKNGVIADLEGGCYVRIDVSMPRNSQVEVYNGGKLISQRFIAMSAEELVDKVDDAWSRDKMTVVNDFLASYAAVGRSPSLSADQLGEVLGDFTMKEDKFTVLRKLQAYVYDRENLGEMIKDNINYFDQEEARRICGL